MDKDTKQKLILIIAVFILALAFYYIASPYQNCVRHAINKTACSFKTTW